MKLKNSIILGIAHFSLINFYVFFGFSKIPSLNIFVLIFLLNLSTYLILSLNFKKSMNDFIIVSFFSFLTIVFCTLIFFLGLSLLEKIDVRISPEFIKKCYNFAAAFEKTYKNFSEVVKIVFTYLLFILMPSFLVLYLSTDSRIKYIKKGRKRKRK